MKFCAMQNCCHLLFFSFIFCTDFVRSEYFLISNLPFLQVFSGLRVLRACKFSLILLVCSILLFEKFDSGYCSSPHRKLQLGTALVRPIHLAGAIQCPHVVFFRLSDRFGDRGHSDVEGLKVQIRN